MLNVNLDRICPNPDWSVTDEYGNRLIVSLPYEGENGSWIILDCRTVYNFRFSRFTFRCGKDKVGYIRIENGKAYLNDKTDEIDELFCEVLGESKLKIDISKIEDFDCGCSIGVDLARRCKLMFFVNDAYDGSCCTDFEDTVWCKLPTTGEENPITDLQGYGFVYRGDYFGYADGYGCFVRYTNPFKTPFYLSCDEKLSNILMDNSKTYNFKRYPDSIVDCCDIISTSSDSHSGTHNSHLIDIIYKWASALGGNPNINDFTSNTCTGCGGPYPTYANLINGATPKYCWQGNYAFESSSEGKLEIGYSLIDSNGYPYNIKKCDTDDSLKVTLCEIIDALSGSDDSYYGSYIGVLLKISGDN